MGLGDVGQSGGGRPPPVVVVGAGGAGLRAARVAAARGHSVVVLDENDLPGGSMRIMSLLPTRSEWSRLAHGMATAAERNGAELRLGCRAGPEELLALDPDAVVFATGYTWDTTGFTPAVPGRRCLRGCDLPHVTTVDRAIESASVDPTALGPVVLIIDETGEYWPLGLADQLSAAGTRVIIVTRLLYLGEAMWESHELRLVLGDLVDRDVEVMAQHVVEEVALSGSVTVRSIWGGPTRSLGDIDSVVLSMLRCSNRALHDEVVPTLPEAHLVGDALCPRRPADAIFDGERVGRSI